MISTRWESRERDREGSIGFGTRASETAPSAEAREKYPLKHGGQGGEQQQHAAATAAGRG